jgi:hypothetical protein
MHGGAPGSGGPKGQRNGNYKHGRYTAEAILRVTLSSALSFQKLEVMIEYLKTLLEPQAGGHRRDDSR